MDERESVTSAAALLNIREPSLPPRSPPRYFTKRDILFGALQVVWAVLFVIIFKEVYHDRKTNVVNNHVVNHHAKPVGARTVDSASVEEVNAQVLRVRSQVACPRS